MRRITFRGKRKGNGEWLYGDLRHMGKEVAIVPIYYKGYIFTTTIEVIQSTVGQYVGMRDKKQHWIYEGDILQYINGDIGFVEFEEKGFCLHFNNIIRPLNGISGDDVKCIGNIYDNPNLVEWETTD